MLKTCTSSKGFHCFWYSLHSFVVSFHQSRSRLSCAFARQANAQLGVPSPRCQLQEHSEHTHNNIYWTETVSKLVLIVMHVWLCVSEFNRRWKCEAAGPPHHTQQHPGSPVKRDHRVSTRTHTQEATFWFPASLTLGFVLCCRVRVGMVQYAAVIQRLFSQTLSAWTPLPETSVGQQRAYRWLTASHSEFSLQLETSYTPNISECIIFHYVCAACV